MTRHFRVPLNAVESAISGRGDRENSASSRFTVYQHVYALFLNYSHCRVGGKDGRSSIIDNTNTKIRIPGDINMKRREITGRTAVASWARDSYDSLKAVRLCLNLRNVFANDCR